MLLVAQTLESTKILNYEHNKGQFVMSLDILSIVGIISVALVIAVLFTLCKLRGCNKPIC